MTNKNATKKASPVKTMDAPVSLRGSEFHKQGVMDFAFSSYVRLGNEVIGQLKCNGVVVYTNIKGAN